METGGEIVKVRVGGVFEMDGTEAECATCLMMVLELMRKQKTAEDEEEARKEIDLANKFFGKTFGELVKGEQETE
jgi:hypothetical protein